MLSPKQRWQLLGGVLEGQPLLPETEVNEQGYLYVDLETVRETPRVFTHRRPTEGAAAVRKPLVKRIEIPQASGLRTGPTRSERQGPAGQELRRKTLSHKATMCYRFHRPDEQHL